MDKNNYCFGKNLSKKHVVLEKTIVVFVSFVLVWRNDAKSPTHFYAPFPGQKSEKDFIDFYNSPYTLFESDLKNIYKK
jgi:mannan endo-1,4-beta-mannosidase